MAIEGIHIVQAAAFLGAGLSMGLGAIGPGVGEGLAAAKACEAIGRNPAEAGLLTGPCWSVRRFQNPQVFMLWLSRCFFCLLFNFSIIIITDTTDAYCQQHRTDIN
ncbi:MAG: ATP synthase F0 subunit C [Desulfobacterales bacterium]